MVTAVYDRRYRFINRSALIERRYYSARRRRRYVTDAAASIVELPDFNINLV